MTKQPHETDVAFIQALAELLQRQRPDGVEVKRDYGENDSLNVRVTKQKIVAQAAPAAAPAPAPTLAAVAPAPAPAPAAVEDPAQHPGAVTSPMVGTVYLSPEPGRRSVHHHRRRGEGGRDPADHRGDEDDEPHPRAARGHRAPYPGRGWQPGRIRRAAGHHRIGAAHVREDPDRQPRRDRAPRHPGLPRDGDPIGRRPFHRRHRRDACAHGRRIGLHRPAARPPTATSRSPPSSRPARSPAPKRSIPAMASSARTPPSCRCWRTTTSPSSARPPSISGSWATRSPPRKPRRRWASRWCRARTAACPTWRRR